MLADITVRTPCGRLTYAGECAIDGVPGTHAPIAINFLDIAGSVCNSLLPTGHVRDMIDDIEVTCIDNGMPVVIMRAGDVGRTGYESRDALDGDVELKARIEAIRLVAGPLMNLGDVADKTVPKMILVAPPRGGGAIATRSFIPHRCHATIGVFAALSVATACLLPEGPAREAANVPSGRSRRMLVEHPTGASPVLLTVEQRDGQDVVTEGALISTARPLFTGYALVPEPLGVSLDM